MKQENRRQEFDETAKEASQYLLEQFWILRDEQPEIYQMVREREHALRAYFMDKLGLHLIVHRYFAKLEKIPAEPEVWMGIDAFKEVKDYSILCCLLAFLEGKNVDEQFLLSDLCEELQSLFPGEEGLDWTHYEHRKSLVRVLQLAADLGVVKLVDGDISGFSYAETYEVLYEVPVVSRYFMRSYPKDLHRLNSKEELFKSEWDGNDENSGVSRRHRVYRQLFLSPVMYSAGSNDQDFIYLRNFRNRILEDLEKHTDFQFELYRNTALLSMPERKARLTLFPENKAIADIALQFGGYVRERQQIDEIPLQYDGSFYIMPADYEKWIVVLKERFGKGWSKQYREALISEIAKDLLEYMVSWKMASKDKETKVISLHPLLVRIVGVYPEDFDEAGACNG
ncbi:TIGR02678 family protein [Desulfitibacter alkalitolerans]|uniref:TIGR02678 family protein n=1 Tax=Desulfitibacter alkalitolerans TaxID=264641 RepID=UPI00048108B5|nr:TIGR02678 family protein [Desulfitibacter alkalitolerans]